MTEEELRAEWKRIFHPQPERPEPKPAEVKVDIDGYVWRGLIYGRP